MKRDTTFACNIALIADIKKEKFQATKLSLLKFIQRIFLLLMGESEPPFSRNCNFNSFMKLVARNQLLRFALHCSVTWKLYTTINTCPASAALMRDKSCLAFFAQDNRHAYIQIAVNVDQR